MGSPFSRLAVVHDLVVGALGIRAIKFAAIVLGVGSWGLRHYLHLHIRNVSFRLTGGTRVKAPTRLPSWVVKWVGPGFCSPLV